MAELRLSEIQQALISLCQGTGVFEVVISEEPEGAPQDGVTAAVFLQTGRVHPARSGLNITSFTAMFVVRLYEPRSSTPLSSGSLTLLNAADEVHAALHAELGLGLTGIEVDLLGQSGAASAIQAGWVEFDDALYRILDLSIPVLVDDVYSQVI